MDMESYNQIYRSNTENPTYKSVQVWKKPHISSSSPPPSPAQQDILHHLDKAAQGKIGTFGAELKNAMAYTNSKAAITPSPHNEDSFQFKDVIDVINPLQHLPLVGMAYRELTGDDIHPMSQIIGGALYGGPVGAVTGTVNAIAKVQTGKDIGEHALEMAGIHTSTTNKEHQIAKENIIQAFDPENRAAALLKAANAFVSMAEPQRGYDYIEVAEGRTAGKMKVKKNWAVSLTDQETKPLPAPSFDIAALGPREKITGLNLTPMPPKKEV
ncbi:MAG: hypothetical protein R3D88_09625 [Alphaproteobacteria bacterium]